MPLKSSVNQRPSLLRAESSEERRKNEKENNAWFNGHFVGLAHRLRSDENIDPLYSAGGHQGSTTWSMLGVMWQPESYV